MKKFLISILLILFIVLGSLYAYFSRSLFIDFRPNAPVSVAFLAEGDAIMHRSQDDEFVPIMLRGVEVIPSVPGHMAWDFAATKSDYLRWFEHIGAMGANAVYVSTTMDTHFYRALYTFNTTNERPLYVLQGVSGYDFDTLLFSLMEAIDIIHGRRVNFLGRDGVEFFLADVSPWIVGFLVGSDWDPDRITFMNYFDPTMPDSFEGEFFSAAYGSSRFEVMLAQVMDDAVSYESRRFKVQRPIGFISNPLVDFLEYSVAYATQLRKYVHLDPENVLPSEAMAAGTFAAYRLFYFTDDFISFLTPSQQEALAHILEDLDHSNFVSGYLNLLARYHTMPVIAAGFGFSSSRAPQIMDRPPMNERQQGESIASMAMQIETSGWGGAFISTWQDAWDRRTWNTAFSADPWRGHYWHSLQSVDQSYGLLAFDPGRYEPPVLIDGNADEWDNSHLIHEHGGIRIYAQYSTHGLYLLVRGNGVSPQNTLFLPIDVTPRSGTSVFGNLEFSRPSDFLLVLSGTHESRLLVNRRYDATFQRFYEEITGINPFTLVPPRWDSDFVPMTVPLENTFIVDEHTFAWLTDEARELRRLITWETGSLTHGIGDPASPYFNSLTDFAFGENLVEIRLPWTLLNFFDPSRMLIHDDYFENFGVEGLRIREIHIGIATENAVAPMSPIPLRGWGNDVQFHERLKQSYFIIQEMWGD